MSLKILAKYLGFLVFLPYQNVPATVSSLEERSQVQLQYSLIEHSLIVFFHITIILDRTL